MMKYIFTIVILIFLSLSANCQTPTPCTKQVFKGFVKAGDTTVFACEFFIYNREAHIQAYLIKNQHDSLLLASKHGYLVIDSLLELDGLNKRQIKRLINLSERQVDLDEAKQKKHDKDVNTLSEELAKSETSRGDIEKKYKFWLKTAISEGGILAIIIIAVLI